MVKDNVPHTNAVHITAPHIFNTFCNALHTHDGYSRRYYRDIISRACHAYGGFIQCCVPRYLQPYADAAVSHTKVAKDATVRAASAAKYKAGEVYDSTTGVRFPP